MALLRVGFASPQPVTTLRGALLPHRFTLTARWREPAGLAVYSLLHFPWARAPQALPGTLSYGARTFLHIRVAPHAAAAWPTRGASITERISLIGNGVSVAAASMRIRRARDAGAT